MRVVLTVNGRPWSGEVPVRLTLSDLLQDRLGLTGTHVGCEQGACGACTVLADRRRSVPAWCWRSRRTGCR